MSENIKVEICPQCGAPLKLSAKKCEYCEAEFIVTSLAYLDKFDETSINKYINHYKKLLKDNPENGELNYGMGICYLHLCLYDLAIKYFSKAIELLPDYSDTYYYYALALLKGRRPKILTFSEIKVIEEYINAAIQIDNTKAKYYYLWAIIKHDFYLMNGFKQKPPILIDVIKEARFKEFDKKSINELKSKIIVFDENLLKI